MVVSGKQPVQNYRVGVASDNHIEFYNQYSDFRPSASKKKSKTPQKNRKSNMTASVDSSSVGINKKSAKQSACKSSPSKKQRQLEKQEQEQEKKKKREAERIFNEVKNNQVKVIDFSKDSENQVDILNVLKKQRSLQMDIQRLKDIEVEQKPSSPIKKKAE